jgi:hypothetical protein
MNHSKSALADRPSVRAYSPAPAPVPVRKSWKDPATISTVSTAAVAAVLLLLSPEIGIGAAVGGVAVGAVSAGIALARPAARK